MTFALACIAQTITTTRPKPIAHAVRARRTINCETRRGTRKARCLGFSARNAFQTGICDNFGPHTGAKPRAP
eukprot:11177819-Lingulodinium_polyedra.AAC.1